MNEIKIESEIKLEIDQTDNCYYESHIEVIHESLDSQMSKNSNYFVESSLMPENCPQNEFMENTNSVSETPKEPKDIKIETNEIADWDYGKKLEEQDEQHNKETNNIDVFEDIKPKYFEKSYSYCSVQNESQIRIDGNTYNITEECKESGIKIKTIASATDNDCFSENQIKAEEDETFNAQSNEIDAVEDIKPRIDENNYNVHKTYDVQDSNVEIGILGGCKFVSTIEIENNLHLRLQNTNNDIDDIQSFVCDMCHDSFTSKRRIIHHIKTFHNTFHTALSKVARNKLRVKTKGKCIKIKKKRLRFNINTKKGTVRNQNVTMKKLFECNVCHKTFNTKELITRHLKKPHTNTLSRVKQNPSLYIPEVSTNKYTPNENGENPHKCNVCKKTFTQSSTLKNHERMHSGEKPHKCNVCKKTFTQSSTLKNHKRLHSGEKPYECNFCIKTFTQYFALKYHERLHSGERPYECNVCKKTFTHSTSLNNHERLHSGEKPHKCNVCKKTFTQNSTLKNHERLHSDVKP